MLIKNRNVRSILTGVLFALFALAPQPASALLKLSVLGGGNLAQPLVKGWQPDATMINNVSSSMGFGWTAGATAELDLDSVIGVPIGFEAGAFYLSEKYGYKIKTTQILDSAVVSDVDLKVTLNHYMFPFLVRYWIFDMVSPGLGFYFSKTHGRFEAAGSTSNGTPVNADSDVPDQLKTDYGLAASLAAVIPLGLFDLRLDGRYYYGLDRNNLDNGSETKHRNIQLLAGAQFSF